MKVGIIGAGRIGGGLATQLAGAGHEAPSRPGAVYGEEYRLPDAMAVVEAARAARPIPPAPHYDS